jgi:ferric-dicitrate binding protein FerR (iron transport regulator)
VSDSLDRLVRESRPELGVREAAGVDWAEVDRRLFEQVDAQRKAEARGLSAERPRAWSIALGGLAAAAAVAFVVVKGRDVGPAAPVQGVEETGGVVASLDGAGSLLVDGEPVNVGASLHLGDVVEAHGVAATVDRPGKLTLVLERGARATVTHVQGALVLGLDEGAVEAQVVPVPNGEAFAVDVGGSRVAVHGTHLRVARSAGHVVVDLNEGVVSLGSAPRVGSTLGALITAPAHAEFADDAAEATLTLTHDPASVRPAVSLEAASAAQARAVTPTTLLPAPKAEVAEAHERGAVAPPLPSHGGPGSAPVRSAPPVPDANPTATVASAVRSCLAGRPRGDNVTVVVSTTLRLELAPDGAVQSARFEPPVAPDVNSCAAGAIYRVRFPHGGSEAIPIDLTLPSSAP